MTRLIVIVVLVVAVIWLLRRAISGPHSRGAGDGPHAAAQGELVACAHCRVNLPKSEAYAASGVLPGENERFYCSEEHLRLGPREG